MKSKSYLGVVILAAIMRLDELAAIMRLDDVLG
jgi:hypothetical protein